MAAVTISQDNYQQYENPAPVLHAGKPVRYLIDSDLGTQRWELPLSAPCLSIDSTTGFSVVGRVVRNPFSRSLDAFLMRTSYWAGKVFSANNILTGVFFLD